MQASMTMSRLDLAGALESPEVQHRLDLEYCKRYATWRAWLVGIALTFWQLGLAESLAQIACFALSNTTQTALWTLVFQNTAMANIGTAGGLQPSSSAGSFFISLHTADPGVAGTQTTSEAAYTSYARVAIARTSGGWTITGNQPCTAENAAACTFPACTGGSETETYFMVGTATSGTGQAFIKAILSSSLAVSNGITPSFAINQLTQTAT